MRTGILSAGEPKGGYNNRMMRIAEATERRMQEAPRSRRQEDLGRAIVAASHWHAGLASRIQERVGNAVVRVAAAEGAILKSDELAAYNQAVAGFKAAMSPSEALNNADELY